MIRSVVDWCVSTVSPAAGVRRAYARKVLRQYKAGESNRLTAHQRPKNQSANSELQGPSGADSARAWARMLVRDNPYAWAALESIVSEVIGTGFGLQSALEDGQGQDQFDTNDARDKTWAEWCEVCDYNGELTFDEIQILAFKEVVEAGECLIRYRPVTPEHKGILRSVPLAMELIEADRLASDHDSYRISRNMKGTRVTRGVEMDEDGHVIAYYIYPSHPTEPNAYARTPERVLAHEIKHLFRKDRVGQSRGVTWFAPIVEVLRSLGVFIDNELQASAVASCFTVAIETETPLESLQPPTTDSDTSDSDGNQYEFLQPGMVIPLSKGEKIQTANPGRPNVNAGPWIDLMVQGIAAGTGTSYEAVSKNFSRTSYSSSRTSKLENRPRFRRWQNYWDSHVCVGTWDRFCNAAAQAGRKEFPTMTELLSDRRGSAPVEIMKPEWEWVDILAEQKANASAVAEHQKSGTDVAAAMGRRYRRVQKKIAQEKLYRKQLGEKLGVDMTTASEAAAKQAEGQGNQANAMAAKAIKGEVAAEPSVTQALQDIYLSVGKVISAEAAQKIIEMEYPEMLDIDLGNPEELAVED